MKQNFESALQFALKWEGGYTDGKTGASRFDRGGATNKGITQGVYDDWRISRGLPRQPVTGLTGVELREIYRDRYWRPVRGDDLPEHVDAVMFDAAINVGPRQAGKWLQRAVGAEPDGLIGPKTLDALKAKALEVGPRAIAQNIIDQRRDFYEYLVDKDATQAVFLKGWCNRCDALRDEVIV